MTLPCREKLGYPVKLSSKGKRMQLLYAVWTALRNSLLSGAFDISPLNQICQYKKVQC
jgi:hypothetical protein